MRLINACFKYIFWCGRWSRNHTGTRRQRFLSLVCTILTRRILRLFFNFRFRPYISGARETVCLATPCFRMPFIARLKDFSVWCVLHSSSAAAVQFRFSAGGGKRLEVTSPRRCCPPGRDPLRATMGFISARSRNTLLAHLRRPRAHQRSGLAEVPRYVGFRQSSSDRPKRAQSSVCEL